MTSGFVPLSDPPSDIVSSIKFSPVYHQLLVGSWDNAVSLYNTDPESLPKSTHLLTRFHTEAPVTSVCWDNTGRRAFLGNTNGEIRELDVENSKTSLVSGEHELGVQSLASLPSQSMLCSGSWDKSLQYIDTRSTRSEQRVALPGKVFALDASEDKVVVAMSNRVVHIYDLRNVGEPIQIRESGLKHQTRDLKCMPNGEGYAQSSIEGRVAIEYFDPSAEAQARKYAFKCHRLPASDMDLVSPVNALAFHQRYGTLFTGGSDCHVCLWDHGAKKRLRQYSSLEQSVVAMDFHSKTDCLAVATSDDSFKTLATTELAPGPVPSKLYLRVLAESEGVPKQK